MWLSRTLTSLLLLLALSACGFKPLYGTDKSGLSDPQAELATIKVGPIPDRLGQIVRNQLVEYLSPRGHAAQKLYDLNQQHSITWVWVKGHNGHPENERCDQLANEAIAEL